MTIIRLAVLYNVYASSTVLFYIYKLKILLIDCSPIDKCIIPGINKIESNRMIYNLCSYSDG